MTDISPDAQRMLDLVARALDRTEQLIAGIGVDDWSSPTPCEEYDVHALVEHLVGGLEQFASVAAGQAAEAVSFEASFPPGAARSRYSGAGARLLSVWSQPGVADRPHQMPWAEVPGVMLLGFSFIEQLGHGWDLARATQQDPGYDDDLAEAALALAREYDDPSIRVPGMFAPIVEIDADQPAIDRLAAFQGRSPAAW